MIPQNLWNIQNTKEDQQTVTLTRFLKDVYTILNKGISPRDNFRGTILTCNFTSVDTAISFKHGLAFAPTDFIVTGPSVNMVVYEFSSNNSFVTLKSSAIGTARILVF